MESIQPAVLASESQTSVSAKSECMIWYDQYGTSILRLCYLYLGSTAAAAHAAQSVFVRLWEQLDRHVHFTSVSVRPWLIRTAVKICRKEKRHLPAQKPTPVSQDPLLSPSDDLSGEDMGLIAGIIHLPEKYRAVVLLICWQKLSFAETASILHIRPVTVLRQLEKAQDLLGKTYESRR